jgi:ABC-type polysaccharide/polyol phosphate transport system ATPase subunit
MKPILEIQHISKKFMINHEQQPYLSLRDSLSTLFKSKKTTEDFWALHDVSFNVEQGDTIGIIGKNGAGKSTLLKILSKITPPTSGKIICRGRIASLLEVGTGFHPELSGRENIFMNGSILGMRKTEILKNFDAIVDFSGVEKFIDTPLKHYSSGMQLRLAFAVAAFLENEILIIDEVLAVGDAEFQKKCMGKMEDVSKSGRTILFVSHNMSAIQQLCKKDILLDKGKVLYDNSTSIVLKNYLNQTQDKQFSQNGIYEYEKANKDSYINKIEFLCDGKHSELLYMGCEFEVIVHFSSTIEIEFPLLGMILYDNYHSPLLCFNNKNYHSNLAKSPIKNGVLKLKIPSLPLMPGIYNIDLFFANMFHNLDVKKELFQIQVEARHFTQSGEMLIESHNKFFIKEVIWEIESKDHD